MRPWDYIGLLALALGISAAILGHHWFCLIWFWGGFVLIAVALGILSRGGRRDKINKAIRSHDGPGDGGNTGYHGGRDIHGHDSGHVGLDGD
jgi:hypothetical protein